MSELARVKSTELSAAVRKHFGLDEEQEVYLKIVRIQAVTRIQQKMRDHVGLTQAEMDIAADLGWIDREQFWHWTPESQAQVRRAESELAEGRYHTYDTVDALFNDSVPIDGQDES
jgi:hypothetical protein